VNTSIKDHARKHARELLDRVAKQNTLENLIKMIIKGDLQMLMKQECSKIYPVGGIEIRKTELYE
jgi:ribosomal protein S3AE